MDGFQAILADWQIDMLGQVFQKDRLRIPACKMEMPSAMSIHWEQAASQTPEGAYFPKNTFLGNIEEYKHNRFINIGVYSHDQIE